MAFLLLGFNLKLGVSATRRLCNSAPQIQADADGRHGGRLRTLSLPPTIALTGFQLETRRLCNSASLQALRSAASLQLDASDLGRRRR
ncbi:hypothetical protein ACFX2C_047251 [Malus domestica]